MKIKNTVIVNVLLLILALGAYTLTDKQEIKRDFYGSNDHWEATIHFAGTMDENYHMDFQLDWQVNYLNQEKAFNNANLEIRIPYTGDYDKNDLCLTISTDNWNSEESSKFDGNTGGKDQIYYNMKDYFDKNTIIQIPVTILIDGIEETFIFYSRGLKPPPLGGISF